MSGNSEMIAHPPPVTVREFGDYFGISPDVVRDMIRRGKVKAFKIGGQWRIPRDAMADLIITQLEKE